MNVKGILYFVCIRKMGANKYHKMDQRARDKTDLEGSSEYG